MKMPELSFVEEITRHAGQILRDMYGQQIEVHHKSTADLVTAADSASEEYLLGRILKQFPTHAINAEESGSHAGAVDHQWFIDPLDGTINFAHGMSMFSVSVAYAHQGQLELGVVYDPLLDECFTVQRGKGAFMNNHRLQVSKVTDLINSLLVTGFRFGLKDTPLHNFNNFERFSRMTQGVRRLGSAALDLCYVAAGRLEGFWEVAINQWDIAAGALLVQEAGGVVTKMFGESDFMADPISILAANPVLHPLICDILIEERELIK
ncbi:MAG: inositol monophosphatase [Anaerolineaceae bacterium]|nr:inositol monophosphatase [Anaerolineaceae bacterium]